MTTIDIHTLLGAYVLDAVDDLERAAFDRHLHGCDDCRAEVDELHEVTARLAGEAWSVPPPRLRDQVMAEVARTRQVPARVPVRPANRRWRLVAAAAAVVAAVGAGTAVYSVQDDRVRREQAIAAAAQAGEARLQSILAAPDVVFRDEPVTGGGTVRVASSRLRNAGVIMLAASAPPSGGRVFQTWTIREDEAPVSPGALPVGQAAVVQVVEGLPSFEAVGVSVEPAGGSRSPTQIAAQVEIV